MADGERRGGLKPISYLAAPFWVVQLASGAKSFRANPLIGSARLNQRGLHAARVRLARAMAERRRQRLAASVGAGEIADYTRDGYVVCRNFLPPELFAEIRRDLDANPLPSWERREGATVTRRASLDRPDIKGRPALAAFLDDNRLFDLMRYVAGCGGEPLTHVQTVIAEPDPSRPDPQNTLHMDTFHSTAKAWLSLQDVGPEDGPLRYVPATPNDRGTLCLGTGSRFACRATRRSGLPPGRSGSIARRPSGSLPGARRDDGAGQHAGRCRYAWPVRAGQRAADTSFRTLRDAARSTCRSRACTYAMPAFAAG